MAVNNPPIPPQIVPAPFDVFRFAQVRTPQKHNADALLRRFINFNASVPDVSLIPSTSLYNSLLAHRLEGEQTAGPTDLTPSEANFNAPVPLSSREAMRNDCIAFKSSTNYINSISALYQLFSGFQEISEWLAKQGKNAVLEELKAMMENKISQTINDYLSDADYLKLKVRVWDNLFAQTILGENFAVLEEFIKVIRILRIMERIAENDLTLTDGQAIYEAFTATILLPENIFTLEPMGNPAEPGPDISPVEDTSELDNTQERVRFLNDALKEIKKAFRVQHMKYLKKLPPKEVFIKDKKGNDIKMLSDVGISHDPLTIEEQTALKLSDKTKSLLREIGVELSFVHVPSVVENIERELINTGDKIRSLENTGQALAVVFHGSIVRFGDIMPGPASSPPSGLPLPSQGGGPVPSVPQGTGNVKPIGVADLKVVQSQLLKYELGEIAHIENILKGETKKRTFRNFNRTETTLFTEEETTTETEKETQTTDRFEMQKESSSVVQEDAQSQEGISVSAKYGFTTGSIAADSSQNSSNSSSQTESNRMATTYAQNVMARALERVIQRKKTQKTVTTIVEYEDTALHSFENVPTANIPAVDNVSGVYRWVDKYYYNKVINYGRRLMFEFIIPEPANYFIATGIKNFGNIPHAEEPKNLFTYHNIHSYSDIRLDNFSGLAAEYGAGDVEGPPPPFKNVIENVSKLKTGDAKYWDSWSARIDIPVGYKATVVRSSILMSGGKGDGYPNYIELQIGNRHYSLAPVVINSNQVVNVPNPYFPWVINQLNVNNQQFIYPANTYEEFDIDDAINHEGQVGVIARIHTDHYAINIDVVCQLTDETFRKWQIETFNAIVQAYKQRKAEYDKWLEAKGVVIQGVNPGENRKIEKREFKKHCVSMITGQRFDLFNAMRETGEFDFTQAAAEGKYIQFFEQAFEWEQVTYAYYPYFWGRKSKWADMISHQDTDPLFTSFLQAGAARIVAPVRPAYEKAILYYLSTGQIWNGGDVPAPNDPLYVSIIDELKEADGQFNGGNQEGEPWISKMPTNLVYLQELNQTPPLPDFSAELIVP
jgi:hypothetical protein